MSKREYIPVGIRRAVYERDGGRCIFLGCSSPLLDLHHVKQVSAGGPTKPSNLACLCPSHHSVIHRDKWRAAVVKEQIAVSLVRRAALEGTTNYPVRITLPETADLHEAFNLYKRCFPPEERDDCREIQRWLRECEELREGTKELIQSRELFLSAAMWSATSIRGFESELSELLPHVKTLQRLASNRAKFERYIYEQYRELEDYFWLDKTDGAVTGFVYFHYYYRHKYAFLSYVISKNPARSRLLFEECLQNTILREHPECRAIIGELDDPRHIYEAKKRKKALGRIKVMCDKWGAKVIRGANYLQPRLRLDRPGNEIPLTLVYYPLQSGSRRRRLLSKREYERILDFIFDSIYGSAFETQESDARYRRYLSGIKAKILRGSSHHIELGTSV